MEKVSMRDVARHAGVSIATVSHVINNTRFVREETRRQVLDSIQALDYSPDAMARSFKTGRRNLIAFIVPDIANSFFATLIEEVETVVGREGYKLIVINTKETTQREIENVRVLGSGVVDGFVVASTLGSSAELAKAAPAGVPLVLADRRLPGSPWDTVVVDNYRAMYEGVEYLIRQGHKQIGYITGLPRISTTIERLEAYRAAMEAYGLPTEHLVRIGDSMSQCVTANLSALLGDGCTALVVSNNVMATEAMLQMIDKGLRPGRDVELLGYKDSDQAQYGLQHMHLICQPTVALGRAAGQQILERLENPELPVRQTVLQATFVPHGRFAPGAQSVEGP